MNSQHTIESVGCDWLTMTWRANDERRDDLQYHFREEIGRREDDGIAAKESRIMQYNGIQSGKLFFGRDENHFYLNVSSYEAHEQAKKLISGRLGGAATRADLEVTAAYPKREETYFEKLRERIGESDLGIRQRAPEKGALYFDTGLDTGVSLGGRKADRKSRFYSAREGGHPEHSEGAVRFEYQYRAARAKQIWSMMAHAASIECVAQSVVTGELMALGLKEPWMDLAVGEKLKPIKVVHDLESRFKWYREQVIPSIVKTVAAGYGEAFFTELEDALKSIRGVPRSSTALELESYKFLFGDLKNG